MNGTPSSLGREISLSKNSVDYCPEVKEEIPSQNCIRKQATKRLQEKLLEQIFSVGKPEKNRYQRLAYPFTYSWSNEPAKQEPASKSVQAEKVTHEQITQRLQEKLLQQIIRVNRREVNRVYQPTYPLERSTRSETAEAECTSKSVQTEAEQIILNRIVSSASALEQVFKFLPSSHESSDSYGNDVTMQDPLKLEVKLEQSADEEPHKLYDTSLKVNDGSNSFTRDKKSEVSSYVQEKKPSSDVVTGIGDGSNKIKVEIKSEECSDAEEEDCCFDDADVAFNWEHESTENLFPPESEIASSERDYVYEEKPKEKSVKPVVIFERDLYNTAVTRAHDIVISIKTMSNVPHEFVGELPENTNVFQLSSSNNTKNKRLLLFGCVMPTCAVCKVAFKNVRNLTFHFFNVHKDIAGPKIRRPRRAFSQASKTKESFEIEKNERIGRHKNFIECFTPDQRENNSNMRLPLNLNFRTQNSYKPSLFLCTVCGKGFEAPCYLRRHLRIHEPRTRQFTCYTCGKSYLTKGNLSKHIKNYHTMQSHRCSYCNRECTTSSGLQTHIRLKHSTTFQYVCHICGEQLARRDYLRRHLRRHYLPEGFSKYGRLGTSKKSRPVCCKYCSKLFPSLAYLRFHLLSHIKSLRYKCQFCSFTFSCIQSRSRHQKRHKDPDYKLSCTICWHRMKTKEELEKHLKVHDKSKKYACVICDATFPSKYLLNHHKVEHVTTAEVEKEKNIVLNEGLWGTY